MTTGQIVAIVVLVLLVAFVVAAVMIFRRRSPGQRRLEAAQHRREAEQHRASAERLEAEAAQRAERARAEQAQAAELAAMARHDREVAEKAQAEAMRLDPHYAEDADQPAVHGEPADRKLEPAVNTAHTAPTPDRSDEDTRRAAVERSRREAGYRRPEPIVGGAAVGMIMPRRARHADDTPERTGQRPSPSPHPEPAAQPRKDRTVGDLVQDRTDTPSATRPDATGVTSARPAADSDTVTEDGERPHGTGRTLADRIMGRS